MKKNSIIFSKWGINNPTCKDINGNLCIESKYLATSEAQSGTMKIDLSGINKTSAFYSSIIVMSVHAGLSLLNLYYSFYEFYQISKIYENIGNYDDELEKIKKSFNDHISEVNLDNDNIDYLIESIKYVRDNIKKDRNKLEELMAKIKTDILKLESKKKKDLQD